MKNKAPLALMEQLIMLMVFAIAAALCLQIFALSGRISCNLETRDNAIMAVQNAAESIKISNGNLTEHTALVGGTCTEDTWNIYYDADWEVTSPDRAVYNVSAHVLDDTSEYLGTADVSASEINGSTLFEITVAWQEVAP